MVYKMNDKVVDLDIRWKQRFENFSRAYSLLSNLINKDISNYEDDIKIALQEALIQRFEYTLDLGWNVLSDIITNDGIVILPKSPKNVIKIAFTQGYLNAEQETTWLDMIDMRNVTSHEYNFMKFNAIVEKIRNKYLMELHRFHLNTMILTAKK
jgi:nucleotidyltransferase substrate binding protein (TIGR01987 family)